jgi:hypothetical protein
MTTITRADAMTLLDESHALIVGRKAAMQQAITSLDTRMDMHTVSNVIATKLAVLREELLLEVVENVLSSTQCHTIQMSDFRVEEYLPKSANGSAMESDGTLTISRSISVTYVPQPEICSHRKYELHLKTSG